MKNAYSLFLRFSLFTFQSPKGPFSWAAAITMVAAWVDWGSLGEDGEPMRGALGGGRDAAASAAAAGKHVSFV